MPEYKLTDTRKAHLTRLMKGALALHEKDKCEIFVRWAGHVEELQIEVHPGGWSADVPASRSFRFDEWRPMNAKIVAETLAAIEDIAVTWRDHKREAIDRARENERRRLRELAAKHPDVLSNLCDARK